MEKLALIALVAIAAVTGAAAFLGAAVGNLFGYDPFTWAVVAGLGAFSFLIGKASNG